MVVIPVNVVNPVTLRLLLTLKSLKISTEALASISDVNVATPAATKPAPKVKFLDIPTPPATVNAPVVAVDELVSFEIDEIPVCIIVEASILSLNTNFSVDASHTKTNPSSPFLAVSTSFILTNFVGGADALDNTRITFCEPILSFILGITLLPRL